MGEYKGSGNEVGWRRMRMMRLDGMGVLFWEGSVSMVVLELRDKLRKMDVVRR